MSVRFRRSARMWSMVVAAALSCVVAVGLCLPNAAGVARAAEASGDCASGAVVVVGGTGHPDGDEMGGVSSRYPDYRTIHANYPATVWPVGAVGYDASYQRGMTAVKQAIAGYQQDCPGNPVVVAGYSQGARIAGDVLSDVGNHRDDSVTLTGADGAPTDRQISSAGVSGELYADPRQSGDPAGEGIELALIGVIPGTTMSGPRTGVGARGFGDLESSVVSVCASGDPICDLPDPIHDPIGVLDGLAGYWVKHMRYPQYMANGPTADWDVPGAQGSVGTNTCADATGPATTCQVAFASSTVQWLREQAAHIGLTGGLPDVVADRPKLDLPSDVTLSDLRPVVNSVEAQLPPLPELGYGAYLPDLYVFRDIALGIIGLNPPLFASGVGRLTSSLDSIASLPSNFVAYWAGRLNSAPQGMAVPPGESAPDETPPADSTPTSAEPSDSVPTTSTASAEPSSSAESSEPPETTGESSSTEQTTPQEQTTQQEQTTEPQAPETVPSVPEEPATTTPTRSETESETQPSAPSESTGDSSGGE